MASGQIIFYDLASKPPNKSWSLNPWKTRFLLNYKGLDYKTEWLQYPEIKPRFKDHLPAADLYTIPTVTLPDGTWVTDSQKIADTLEKQHPEPSLHLDSPLLPKVQDLVTKALIAIVPILVPRVPKYVLDEASKLYWYENREKTYGPLDQLEAEKGGELALNAAAPHLRELTALLKENTDGPFFLGNTVSYADFVYAGFLICLNKLGDDTKEGLLNATGDAGVTLKLLEAVEPWAKRDDH
ncbi:putative glutathione S-transferase [Biscogniauxia marginata]|nr:putative glutathione S-transferase [Biscogniauxia marginata]